MTEEELLQVIEKAAAEGWEELDLSGKGLTTLPPEIGKLTQLKKLILGKHKYDQGYIIDTIGNKLSELPKEIGWLAQLEELQIIRNQLDNLPAEIVQLTNLQSLHLEENQLSSLPAEIARLSNLQSLDLSYNNKLIGLPAEIVQLSNLQSLRLRGNKLSSLPTEVVQLSNLQNLDLRYNQLSSLPAEIAQLSNLQNLDLWHNKLSSLPAEIAQLSNLQNLDLSFNKLSSLPAEIVQLSNLQNLDLRYNQLSNLPVEIVQLSNLQSLNLTSNQLNSLLIEIFQLTSLQSLNLSHNKLSSLPVEIGQLNSLQSLNLSYNKLSSLPAEIGQLTCLQSLNLRNNQLNRLPTEIGHLHLHLKVLTLDNNPLKFLPAEIRNRHSQRILNFYKQQLEQTIDRLYEAKLLIIGEGGAGKTSLAKKIEDEEYKLRSDEESTEGIDVIEWKFSLDNGKEFRVNIWDFGGQEIYHQTHQFFLTERSLYALVADSRRENTNFYWWMKVAELLSDKSPIFIVKNEKQERQCEVSESQLRGEFSHLKEVLATNLATNRGLEEIKKNIQFYIYNLPHVGTELPKIWVEIRSAIENYFRNYISREEYYQLCRKHNLTKREDMLLLSSFLHDLGVFLHFQKDSILKHYVILKPEWATTAVYKVLDNKTVKQNLGCFSQDELADIWQDSQYADMQDELLQLMMRFKLCYPIPNRCGNYIAPQLLETNQPEYSWNKSNNLILRYKYDFMPKGILTRFIVETHPWIEQQKLVWKSGVILDKYQTRAEVIENYNQREIKVRVSGNRKKDLLTVVTHELEKIHRSFERLKYQTLVPCNCSECMGSENPYSYPLENLRRRLEKRRYTIECEQSFEMVDVRRLIDDVNLPFQVEYREFQAVNTPLQLELENERNLNLNVKSRELRQNRGQILKKLRDAIINAYPNKNKLDEMVYFELEENINSIVGEGDMEEIVFKLIKWADSKNKLEQLVKAAREYNPDNRELQKISEEMNCL
ncbi:Leucine Rich Repeat (LRR)-containing protein [Rivularia sp. PCC 7116]|uniref:COR domain-containing protein n=1 Tax=Rivularia sp. PCC 7116 TaxID=373994 RepID=UPI00029EC519|nr:COR domain-containing protein [Rivularia sp. PCC 7116]AFY57146.1 Leucine Rich Repeat (LRR)-containing protein [Rivularia sp. PCC 7116]